MATKKSGKAGVKKASQKRPAAKDTKSGGDVESGGQAETQDVVITLSRETAIALVAALLSSLGTVEGTKIGGKGGSGELIGYESVPGDEGSRGW